MNNRKLYISISLVDSPRQLRYISNYTPIFSDDHVQVITLREWYGDCRTIGTVVEKIDREFIEHVTIKYYTECE